MEYNNWAEADGIEPDLSVVDFEAKSVKLTFLLKANTEERFWNLYREFIAFMSAPGYRRVTFVSGLHHEIRYNTGSAFSLPIPFDAGVNLTSFTMEFYEDKHSINDVPYPTGGIPVRGHYALNGYDLAEFGISVEEGREDILKYPALKKPFVNGKGVSLSTLNVQHKEIKLKLCMVSGLLEEFLNNYQAFFYQLSRTGTISLYIKSLEGSVSVYYSDCNSYTVEKWGKDRIATRFTITLVVPVVTWVNAGGTTELRVLLDDDMGILTDEGGLILVLG
ncbi:MAG: hypothetical protein LUD74_03600 [Tannerellaceae bacterium]|nr:hypothetical protein [Tannerellaceae bacterium]